MSALRIAHLIESDGPGGAERVVAQLASALQASGAGNVVFLPRDGEEWLARELDGSGSRWRTARRECWWSPATPVRWLWHLTTCCTTRLAAGSSARARLGARAARRAPAEYDVSKMVCRYLESYHAAVGTGRAAQGFSSRRQPASTNGATSGS